MWFDVEVVGRASETQLQVGEHLKVKCSALPVYVLALLIILFNGILTHRALHNLIFHPLEVVSRYREPQLQLSQNYLHKLCKI